MKMTSAGRWAPGIVLLLCTSPLAASSEWPQWGGPGRDFRVRTASLPRLPEGGPAVVWRESLGPGFSAVVSDGERVVTMYRRGDQDVIACFSAGAGKRLWEHVHDAPVEVGGRHVDTSYGTGPNSTPALAGGLAFTLSFSGIATAVHLEDGTPAWTHDLGAEYGVRIPYFGHSASPIPFEDTVIFIAGGAFAFDARTGAVRWQNRSFDGSYASPILVPRSEGPVLVGAVAGEVVGLDPATGELFWRHEHANQHRTILSTPVFGDDDLLFVSAFFLGSIGLRLSPDGRSVTEVWEIPHMQVSHSNAVRVGGWIYGFHRSILTAVDAATGEIGWRHRGMSRSNLVQMGDRFLLLDDLGKLSLVSLSPEGPTVHGETRVFQGRSWTMPTIVGNRMYVRDEESLVALDLRKGAARTPVASASRSPVIRTVPPEFTAARGQLEAAAHRSDLEALAASREAFAAWTGSAEIGHLAHYYSAFAAWREAVGSPAGRALALVDQTVEHARAAVDRERSFADAHVLLARLYPMYYRLNPQRAAVIGPLSNEHMDLAVLFEPENPRVVVGEGIRLIYRPVEYGGDPAAGLERVRHGLKLFEEAGPQEGAAVGTKWGHALAWTSYGQALLQGPQQDAAEARRALRRALEIEPELASAKQLLESMPPGALAGGADR